MIVEVRPASVFEDIRALVGPKSPGASVCWCLSYRIPAKLNNELRGAARGDYVAELSRREPPPGVLAYDGAEPVGWAAVAPRSDTSFAYSRKIPHIDELPVWSLWCIRVRPGHPLDNGDAKVDMTMAYAGIRRNFVRAGFAHAADTTSVLAGHPRVLMRLDLH